MDAKRPPPKSTGKRSLDSEPESGRPHLSNIVNELVLPEGTYRYSPLGPNEIRLLHLFPADHKSDSIRSELKAARLDDPQVQYEALSYTWGYEEPSEIIWIEGGEQQAPQQPSESSGSRSAGTPKDILRGAVRIVGKREREKHKTFYVRPNLSDALRHLRDYSEQSPKTSPETLVIWIDAICINQEAKDEKSEQVRMMADIYKRADSVFIWLGREGEESNIGMNFVSRIPDLESHDMLSIRGSDAQQWGAFMTLMRRAWFSRRWVVQELALAKQVYLRCGDISVNWVDFVIAVEFFIKRYDTITALYSDSALFKQKVMALGDIRASAAPKMVTVTNTFVRGTRERRDRLKTLEALVSELTMFEAGDPRDTVYAVMALAWDTKEGEERRMKDWRPEAALRPSFKVDYQKNILQVFTDFVAFCVHGSGSLDIICRRWAPNRRIKKLGPADRLLYRGRRPPLEEIHLPSWIGLLKDSAFGIPQIGPQRRVAGNSLVDTSLSRRYNASGGTRAEVLFGESNRDNKHDDRTPDLQRKDLAANPSVFKATALEALETDRGQESDGTMYVRGFQVDCIQKISHRLYEGFIPYEWLVSGGWRQRSYDAGEGNHIPEELWRTLVANRTPEGEDPPQRYLVALNWAIERHNANNDINTAELIRQGQPEEMVNFLKRVQEVIWNRRFFLLSDRTDGISYRFGIAPTDAKVGDIVCVLLGCNVPVVLRPRDVSNPDNIYKLVGEAYLHGVMDGEVLSMEHCAGYRKEDIKESSEEFCLV